ncbi:unnamed protein product [Acanthoscelides obtectus]|uniref:Uncharacterized protein n=1 Tax=Acanthoscelides obtectus TaxID=200917 RepID=A0A9P0KG97_ACAOB|nr:unnamed protein product [Acanthoscelides obtectus]CAK1646946.1 hypothetical protein AOBTE_LOCUS14965 [Acanthoscelides obtectus]
MISIVNSVHKNLSRRSKDTLKETKVPIMYAAFGCSFKDIHYTYRVRVSTVSNIIKEVSRFIWNNLSEKFMRLPTSVDEWEQTSIKQQLYGLLRHVLFYTTFIRDKEGSNSDNNVSEEFSYENLPHEVRTRGGNTTNLVRTEFVNYFMSEDGSVPWQDEAFQNSPVILLNSSRPFIALSMDHHIYYSLPITLAMPVETTVLLQNIEVTHPSSVDLDFTQLR